MYVGIHLKFAKYVDYNLPAEKSKKIVLRGKYTERNIGW